MLGHTTTRKCKQWQIFSDVFRFTLARIEQLALLVISIILKIPSQCLKCQSLALYSCTRRRHTELRGKSIHKHQKCRKTEKWSSQLERVYSKITNLKFNSAIVLQVHQTTQHIYSKALTVTHYLSCVPFGMHIYIQIN